MEGGPFWPHICPDGIHLAKCVTDWVGIPEFCAPAIRGRTYNSIFHGDRLKFRLVAVYISWQCFRKGNSHRGFCLSNKVCVKLVFRVD